MRSFVLSRLRRARRPAGRSAKPGTRVGEPGRLIGHARNEENDDEGNQPNSTAKAPRPRLLSRETQSKKGGASLGPAAVVAGQTPRSVAAFANLKKLYEEHLPGQHESKSDLLENPNVAAGDQIVAIPTLVEVAGAIAQNRGRSSRH